MAFPAIRPREVASFFEGDVDNPPFAPLANSIEQTKLKEAFEHGLFPSPIIFRDHRIHEKKRSISFDFEMGETTMFEHTEEHQNRGEDQCCVVVMLNNTQ